MCFLQLRLFNCIAWLPFLEQNSKWYAAQCDQWWFLLGLRPRKKGYLILSWLNFEPWELSGAQQVLNFIFQMSRAPRGSFLAALLAELRSECTRSPKSWLFGALRLLSRALAFRRAACLLARVDNMIEYVRESKFSLLRETFRENYSKAILQFFPLSGSNLRVDPDSVSFLSRLFELAPSFSI